MQRSITSFLFLHAMTLNAEHCGKTFFVMERIKHHDYARTGTNLFFWRDKQQNEVDIVEVSENGTMSAIECKVKEECVSPPQSFVKKYPECRYRVATMGNCFRFFADED